MDELLRFVTDISQDGIICVDREGIITLFNRKAMEIMGTAWVDPRTHPAGVIEPGDIVLIADNMIGEDDGGLTPQLLEVLNICEEGIRMGDALLAAGVYGNDSLAPLYRSCGQLALPQTMTLEGNYLGLDMKLCLDSENKNLVIEVNGLRFDMRFQRCNANVVVVDGATGAVKFFQGRGSTVRREDLGDLLRGNSFAAKNPKHPQLDVVGENFFALFLPGGLTQRLSAVLTGQAPAMRRESQTLNHRLLLTSIHPMVQGREVGGAVVELSDLSEMDQLLRQRNELIAQVEETNLNLDNRTHHVPPEAFSSFAGSAPPIQRVKYMAYRAAQSRCNVIITGESGTGKSQLAKEIHLLSRPGKPFVEVNCSSIPQELFESELFGYVGGAFTGALAAGKPGYFEQAEGGTLFLDELAELPPNIQVKLLYVIQNKRFYRVGATKPTDVDIRILCATNKDLARQVREGGFREDLFYRVNVFPIEIPPLRARISDIYLLSKSITERTCDAYGMIPKQLSGKALEKLVHYDWPGNIRELGNVIERAIAVSDGEIIYPDAIMLEGTSGAGAEEEAPPFQAYGSEGEDVCLLPLHQTVARAEERAIRAALAELGGDKKRAMEELGLKKTTFYEKLRTYHI